MTPGFPLIGIGQGSEGGIDLSSFLPPLASISPSTSNTPSGVIGGASKTVTGALGKIYDAASSFPERSSFLGLLFGDNYQYLTGIIGLILIIAGIFLFKPVRETVVNVSKTAAKGAALVA